MPPDTKSPTSSPTPRSPSPRPIAATEPKLPSPTTTPPPNPLKRTASRDVEHPSSPSPPSPQHVPASSVAVHVQQQQQQSPQQGEYETGRVICECGAAISFRDEKTGGFDLKLWDAHRLSCPASVTAPSGEPVIYTPESTAHALANPPVKRRRAKRTEDERIDYLRADPYVAQFEAYRVLCASCDKWIRLRPNSTYCSIPWDAHRKSCLAKKIKNVYALEERNALFAKDPDVRKFDAERVLCNMCDRWIALNPDDHLQAVQKWLQHRASCQKGPSQSSVNIVSSGPVDLNPTGKATSPDAHHSQLQQHPQQQQQPHHANGVSGSNPHQRTPASPSPRPSTSSTTHQAAPIHRPSSSSLIPHHSSHHHQQQPPPHPHPHGHAHQHQHQSHHSSSSFHDLNPANYTPAHESRRRNAEQRAATLRADTLIGEVEPNRVFCTLCQKWVQLRQDSSYCAYPWLQHRTKCLARHQRRAIKAAEIAKLKANKQHTAGGAGGNEEDELMSDQDGDGDPDIGGGSVLSDDPESEDGMGDEHEQHQLQQHQRDRHSRLAGPGSSSIHVQNYRLPQTSRSNGHGGHPHVHGDRHMSHSTSPRPTNTNTTTGNHPSLPMNHVGGGSGEDGRTGVNGRRKEIASSRRMDRHHPYAHHHAPGSSSGGRDYGHGHGHGHHRDAREDRYYSVDQHYHGYPHEGGHHVANGHSRHRYPGSLGVSGMMNGNGRRRVGSQGMNGSSSTSMTGPQQYPSYPYRHGNGVNGNGRSNPYPSNGKSGSTTARTKWEQDVEDVEMDADGEVDGEGDPDVDIDADGDGVVGGAGGDNDNDVDGGEDGDSVMEDGSRDGREGGGGYSTRGRRAVMTEVVGLTRRSSTLMTNGTTGTAATTTTNSSSRSVPVGLADLDSPTGRRNFIFISVDYLFATTYERTDDLTISALMTYLNAAMPQDKHEDFDTSEVTKAAVALQDRGRIAFEGDMLRLRD